MEDRDTVFSALYRQNAARMLRYAVCQLRSRQVAEELVEDAFVLFLRKYDSLTDHPNPAGWLWKTLQHLILTEIRSAKYRMELPMEEGFDPPAPPVERERLADVLPEGLTAREREILLLFYEADLSHEEIAAQLGISVLNSRTRLFRAKNHCRQLWENEREKASTV